MTTSDAIAKLRNNKDFVFLIGNGINRHYDKCSPSWSHLLNSIAEELNIEISIADDNKSRKQIAHDEKGVNETEQQKVQTSSKSGLTNPEFFSLIERRWGKRKDVLTVLKEHKDKFNKFDSTTETSIKKALLTWNVPVLTTNYDKRLDFGRSRNMSCPDGHKRYYDFPLNTYYSPNEIQSVCSQFAVWHIHGSFDASNKIQISLDDYLNYVNHVSPKLRDFTCNTNDLSKCKYADTWLYPFLTKTLCFVGVGLEIDEVFLRWLLLQRKQMMRNGNIPETESYYFCIKKDLTKGKEMFLENVGVKPIPFKGYNSMYKNLFNC